MWCIGSTYHEQTSQRGDGSEVEEEDIRRGEHETRHQQVARRESSVPSAHRIAHTIARALVGLNIGLQEHRGAVRLPQERFV